MGLNGLMTYVSLLGAPVALGSFLAYVFIPDTIYMILFAIGIAMMVIGYVFISYMKYRTSGKIREAMVEADNAGYVLCLDETYVPYHNEATIETLE
jgi:hypothetical protein